MKPTISTGDLPYPPHSGNPNRDPATIDPFSVCDDHPISGAQWYFVSVMALVYLVSTFDRTIVAIMIEPLKHEFGLPDRTMGLIVGFAFAGSYSLALLPIAILINHVNRRNLLALVVFVWSAATALGAFATGAISLLLARLVVGAAEAGSLPTALSMISDVFSSKRRGTAVGLFSMGAGIGAALTGLVGASIVHNYGWRQGFFVAAVPGMLLAALIMLTIREPRRGAMDPPALARSAKDQIGVRAVFRLALADGPLICCYAGYGMMMLAMSATGSWLVPLLVREQGLSLPQAGLAFALILGCGVSFGGAFGGPMSDYLAQRHPAWRLIFCAILAAVCIPIGWGAILSSSLPLAIGLFLLWNFVSIAFQGPALATVLNRLPPLARGGGTAIAQILANLVGYGLGAYSVGLASDLIGGPRSLGYGLLMVQTSACALALIAFAIGAARYGARERFASGDGPE